MKLKYLLLAFILILSLDGYGQISSQADYAEPTEYSDSDFVYVFCTEDVNGGMLIANDSTGIGGYNFEWYKFNEATLSFSDVLEGFSITSDSTSSTISNLTTGGYKVILTKGSIKQEYVGWVLNNVGRKVEIKFSDENDCDFFGVQADPYIQRAQSFNTGLSYYDTISDQWFDFKNSVSYKWSSDPEEDDFYSPNAPYASIVEDPFDNESELPTENTVFSVIVTDRFGCKVEDDIEYTAIETDANFSWTTLNYKTKEIIENGGSNGTIEESAPLIVKFTNESLNGVKYTWFFGDTLWNNDIDTVKTSDFLEEPEHTYYYTVADSGKTYVLRLYSESEYGCVDSIFFNIKLKPSKISFPNVFTPNHDGINDVFQVDSLDEGPISIRDFKITIFNRVGQVVHEFEGDVHDWGGWDGKVRNSNREAPAGNYFFVVEVTGWDNVDYNNNNLSNSPTNNQPNEGGGGATDSKDSKFGVIRLYR